MRGRKGEGRMDCGREGEEGRREGRWGWWKKKEGGEEGRRGGMVGGRAHCM